MTLSIQVSPGKPKLGSSKIGGKPDLPARTVWPSGDWEPHAFLLQLNLEEVHTAAAQPGLPARGMLYLFCTVDEGALSDPEPETAVVYAVEPTGLAPRDFPEELDDTEGIMEERRLSFAAGPSDGPGLILGPPDFHNSEVEACFEKESDVVVLKLRAKGVLARKGDSASIYGAGVFHLVINRKAMDKGRLQEMVVLFEKGV
jgi:hypothetical protein